MHASVRVVLRLLDLSICSLHAVTYCLPVFEKWNLSAGTLIQIFMW